MDFVKKNKFTIIAVAIFLLLIILLVQIKNVFSPDEERALYGNRLEGIEKVKITTTKKKAIEKNVISDGIAKKAEVRISGRIVETIIIVNEEASTDSAKTLADKVVEKLTKNEKAYYDIQVFINKENDSNDFPIIGYKHHSKDSFSWTKNR